MSEYTDEFGLWQKDVGSVGDLLIVKVVGALLKQYWLRFTLYGGGEEVHIPGREDGVIYVRRNLDHVIQEQSDVIKQHIYDDRMIAETFLEYNHFVN